MINNSDCLDGMSEYDDNHFDLAIVDPPYGIGETWSKSRRDRFYQKGKIASYKNNEIPGDNYFNELFRVSKNQIIWGGNYYTHILKPTNAWILWAKGRDANKTFMSEAEMAWTSFSKCTRVANFLWDGARKCEQVHKIHPHQKPVLLYRWVIKNYSNPGAKILDTHVGSGSSLIAAEEEGCSMVCFEIDKVYWNSLIDRYMIYKNQLKLAV